MTNNIKAAEVPHFALTTDVKHGGLLQFILLSVSG